VLWCYKNIKIATATASATIAAATTATTTAWLAMSLAHFSTDKSPKKQFLETWNFF